MIKARKQKQKPKPKQKPASPQQRMLAKLKESGLNDRDAKALDYVPMTTEPSAALKLSRAGDGFKLPYFTPEGEPMPKMFRYRFFDTESPFLKDTSLPKYGQPFGSGVEAYFPRINNTDWEKIKPDTSTMVYIVEGELKSACVTKHVAPCIALGGVFNFGGTELIPSLRDWKWSGREVRIVFDADKVDKPLVRLAEVRLADALTRRGAVVSIVNLPPGGSKGADDFIVEHGAQKFKDLDAVLFEPSRHQMELSAQYALIRQGGMILEFPTGQYPEVRLHTEKTFKMIERHRKSTRKVEGVKNERTVVESAVEQWLESHDKPTYERQTYLPGGNQITHRSEYNAWRPSGIEPVAGDTSLFDQLTAHLIPNAEAREYALQWAAYPLQHPGVKMNAAMLMWSFFQGNGKNLWGETIGLLHGRHNYTLINQEHLNSRFNSWIARKTFISGEEVCGDRDSRALADKIKTFITAEEIWIDEKNQPRYLMPNFASFYFTSNHPNALFIDDYARRFFVNHATEKAMTDPKFYKHFCKWRDEENGLQALLHKLMRVDLVGFNSKGHAFRTADHDEMVDAGRSDLQMWCRALKIDPAATLIKNGMPVFWASSAYATALELLEVYNASNPNSKVNPTQLGLELAAAGLKQAHDGKQMRVSGAESRSRMWIINPLMAININPDNDLKKIKDEYLKTRQIGRTFAKKGGK